MSLMEIIGFLLLLLVVPPAAFLLGYAWRKVELERIAIQNHIDTIKEQIAQWYPLENVQHDLDKMLGKR